MARLTWTEPALRDLETIAEYIALDKPEAARAFVRKVFRVMERLAALPKSGRVSPEIPDLPYREVVVPPCRVFYRIDRQTVLIIHVMNHSITSPSFPGGLHPAAPGAGLFASGLR